MPDSCPLCKKGTIKWKESSEAYLCSECSFEVPFRLDKRLPTYFMRSKHFLGSFIKHERDEKEYWRKLRKLHRSISTGDEWQRRKEHFDASVDKNTHRVRRVWVNRITPKMNDYKKGEIAIDITSDNQLSKSVVCEILQREHLWNYASFGTWNYMNVKQYGQEIRMLYKKFMGNRVFKEGNVIKIASLINRISEKTNLDPYVVLGILSYSGIAKGGNWAFWTSEKIREYGDVIINMYENRKHKVKDEWSLCETVDGICEDAKNTINPYIAFSILSNTRKIDVDPKTIHFLYPKYKYAKKSLEIITQDGPQCADELEKRFDVCSRVINTSLKFLYDNGFVERFKGDLKRYYFYVKGQEQMLKEKGPHYKLEEIVLKYDKNAITIPELCLLGKISEGTSKKILDKFVKQGKLAKINEVSPRIYVFINDYSKDESIQKVITEKYSNILGVLGRQGADKKHILKQFGLESRYWKRISEKLVVLEKYGLVHEQNGLYYRNS